MIATSAVSMVELLLAIKFFSIKKEMRLELESKATLRIFSPAKLTPPNSLDGLKSPLLAKVCRKKSDFPQEILAIAVDRLKKPDTSALS